MPDVKPVPDEYPQLSPYIWVDDAAAAIGFYTSVFGATERMRMPMGDKIVHCELQVGDSLLMLADEFPEMGALAPKAVGGSPMMLSLYVDDVDSVVAKAITAGAKKLRDIEDRFYGDRVGEIEDPFGTAGASPPTSKTCRPTRCRSGPRPWRRKWAAGDPPSLTQRRAARPQKHGEARRTVRRPPVP